jgi:hypothetical protein
MEAYPEAVYKRADGIVIIDPAEASDPGILESCPYGVIYWNPETNIAQKCTFCAHLVDQGKNPKCVDACPTNVLHYGDLHDPTSYVSQMVASGKAKPLHPEWGSLPKVFYTEIPTPTVAGYLMCSKTKMDVVGAVVALRSLKTGETVLTESNHAGNFQFENLQRSGLYIVRVEAPGYYPRSRIAFLKGDGYAHLGRIKLYPR